ncbi:MAG: PAS domain S-box protein [Nibricoccus sp.]
MPPRPAPLQSSSGVTPCPDALLAKVVADSTQALVVCVGNVAGRPIIYANREFEKLTGYSSDVVMGRTLSNLLRPPGGQFEWDRVDAVLSDDHAWRKPLPAARKDGTVFWADLHLYPLKQDNVITHWVGIVADVTDHLELHDALHQSEARHRLLAENVRDLITVHRADGRCLYASPSAKTMLGYEPEELVGKPLRLILHHADRPQVRRVFESHLNGRRESTLVHRLQRKDGTFIWAETISRTRLENPGKHPVEIISISRDISKRRQAEDNLAAMHNLLNTVYETVPIGLCLLDKTHRIIQCNRAFAVAFSQAPDVIAGTLAEQLLPALALNRATINQQTPVECECVDAHGATFPAELTVVSFEPNAIASRLVALNSLRERKKIEARLREVGQLESLGTLAGGIAHDFNNMLSIVLAYASLLRDASNDPARISHYADTIIDAGRRGADVVRQLQLFASTHEAEISDVNIHDLLDRLLADESANWPSNIKIVKAFGASAPSLSADPAQLAQAIGKLLDNAREAMPEGGTLTLRTSELRQAAFGQTGHGDHKSLLRISVEDTGVGMDAATRTRMFEPFFSSSKKDTPGLGLAVVYGIMRAHRGSIEVDSAPGQGTRVHLLFPLAESRPTEKTRAPYNSDTTTAERRTILIAEDEQDIGALWQEFLPTDGWRVLWARDGAEALRLFRAHRDEIALVFTDIVMPSMDGWQLANSIRQEAPAMPLLFASGAFRRGDRKRGYAEPVAYLSKPYVPSKALKLIRTLVPISETPR